MFNKIANRVANKALEALEKSYRLLEKRQFTRGHTLELIPPRNERGGGLGTTTYGEWCYTIGIFQSLIFRWLPKRPIHMLDVGCGVGRLYLAAKPYLDDGDHYTGIDVGENFIGICRSRYKASNCSFIHTAANNAYYAKNEEKRPSPWPLQDSSYNLITALSVWTHLREEDWKFYLKEVERVLTSDGRAIISFFIIDDLYQKTLRSRTNKLSKYYPQPQDQWIFDRSAYGSEDWSCPSWTDVPEAAIAVKKSAFDKEILDAGLKVIEYMPGAWKEHAGFFFQDVVVLGKIDNLQER